MSYRTIGIPKGLFYYYLYPLWETFFTQLGFKVILSPNTDKKIVDLGIQKAVDEVCYPVKIYYGHVASLIGRVDYLFLPRIISIQKKSYICPKFMGLPDMIRANFDGLPEIIDQKFDDSQRDSGLDDDFMEMGLKLGFEKSKVKQAYLQALAKLSAYQSEMQQGAHPMQILDGFKLPVRSGNLMKIGLLGHGYNIYDSYASMNIIKKLNNLGVEVITAEMVPEKIINEAAKVLPKRIFWTLGHQVVGSAFYLTTKEDIAGLIHVASFGCGPDSMIGEIVERFIRRSGQKPILTLTIDEHTGEAGLDTRLEAFIDMISRRNIS